MIKRLSALFLLAVLLAGCSSAVKTTLSERYGMSSPGTVAVAPVVWEAGEENRDVAFTFRTMTAGKLEELNYRAVPLGSVDRAYAKLGAGASSKSPAELAMLLNADAVLFIKIREWTVSRFLTYASLTVEADYELYAASGERLWSAGYSTRDADLRLDKKSMEYAIIKAYEPKVQRFVDAVFTTLPVARASSGERTFFKWLP